MSQPDGKPERDWREIAVDICIEKVRRMRELTDDLSRMSTILQACSLEAKHRRRLTDRIRDLCARVVVTPDGPELYGIMQELRAALYEDTRIIERASLPHERRTSGL